ncbi:MAG: hypothetical protein CMI53_01610 [Parcubacteria group bacterium]|nr:hypothetical protein [Parcubacteria group bacterium]|tara:strand:+ start:606 stop:1784 length:1179 start_codon:yes stop_codon:yes gene_type:complete
MRLIKRSGMLLMVFAVLVSLVMLTGCLNYKSYQPTDTKSSDSDLIKEIAEIEKELGLADNKTTGAKKDTTKDTTAKKDTSKITGATTGVKDTTKKDTTAKNTTATKTKGTTADKIKVPLNEKSDTSKLQKIKVKESELVNLNVKIDDPDSDKITYSFSLPLNQQGKWKTNYGDAGEYVITITATDGKLTSKKDVLLVVERVNVPPIIKTIKDKTVKEGETIKLEPQVIDPNGDSVTIKLSEPLTKGLWVTDHTSAGEYELIITASDGELETKEKFLLTVTDVNMLPKIASWKDVTIKEGQKIEFAPQVTDLDKDQLNVSVQVSCSSGCQFLKAGDIAKTCQDKCEWQTSYTDHGIYSVVVTADDGKEIVTKTASLTITDENRPPTIGEIKLG